MAQEEKLEEAKRLYETANADQRYVLESLFPELKESEDEKIRKALIHMVTSNKELHFGINNYNGIIWEDILAWLEKQGESDETKAKMFLINNGYPIDTNGIFPTYEEMYNIIKEGFENQGKSAVEDAKEEKVDNANKVEPKFKVGDWCIDNEDGTILQIVKVLDNTYTYKTNEGKEYSCTHYSLENDARLWTIQDAKDGDVFCYEDEMFILKNYVLFHKIVYHCCYDGKNFIPHNIYSLTKDDFNNVHPATKEQYDLLFAKMEEAGYKWDAEKKELKKIEQKPTWSEEEWLLS